MTKEKIFLIIIFIFSFLIRIFRAGDYPPLLWDEAALGYNAYSILHTARDEYGQFLPLVFKSFGDYKPGLYVYLTLPFIALFGLNPLAIRLPSVILGSFTPILLYLLIKNLSPKSVKIALIASVLISVNPYNIHFSRGAWETNIFTFELLLASYLFFKKHFYLSSFIFALSLSTYQSAKLLTPLFIIFLFFLARSTPKFKFLVIFFLLSLGLLFQTNPNRLKVMSLFSYPRSPPETQTIINESNSLDYQIFHNRLIFFARNFLSRYFNHFSPKFLAFDGDWQNPRHSTPYLGVLLYPSLVFFIIGLLSSNYVLRITYYFLFWLLIAPLPAALTRDSVSAVRAMSLSIPLIYFTAIGISRFLKFKYLIIIAYLLSFIYYSDLYLNHLVKKSPKDFLYGYHQAINYLISHQNQFQNIYFTPFYGQPYIYYLFYSHYPPAWYQSQAKLITNSPDTGNIQHIDNLKFIEPNFAALQQEPSTLAIFSHDEILRQNINPGLLISLSPINNYSTFYAYQNP